MADTDIEWADSVANPVTGCDRTSPGCDHCYALSMARRLKAMGQPKYQRDGDPRTSGPGFGVAEHPGVLAQMLRRRKPAKVFLNSMSDLFHQEVSDQFAARVFAAMALTPHVTYQVLTKRHARMRALLSSDAFTSTVADAAYRMARGEDPAASGTAHRAAAKAHAEWSAAGGGAQARRLPWPLPNVWLGVSAETQQWADIRIPALLETPAVVRWVSAEPLLGPIELDHPRCDIHGRDFADGIWCTECSADGFSGEMSYGHWLDPLNGGIAWVVVGGESGPDARPMDLAWAEILVHQCREAGVPVLVKQLGTVTGGRRHHDINTFPAHLRVREYPTPQEGSTTS